MTKKKENRLSTLGLVIAKAFINDELPYENTDIDFGELRALEKRFDFAVFVKAYLHCLSADRNYKKTLTLKEAIGTIALSGLKPQGRSRESVLELLTDLRLNDAAAFLDRYEELHEDRFWISEADVNEQA